MSKKSFEIPNYLRERLIASGFSETYLPDTGSAARSELRRWEEGGREQFSGDQIRALQRLDLLDPERRDPTPHQHDRAFGTRLRKNRTGNRRGEIFFGFYSGFDTLTWPFIHV